MRPLTDSLPKPLLRVGGKALIEYHLEKLAQAGFADIVVNHAHLGHMIEAALGDGGRYGLTIHYSREPEALETAGGIVQALPILKSAPHDNRLEWPFLTVNADIYCEIDFSTLIPVLQRMQSEPDRDLGHLVLVDNPVHHPGGDFVLNSGRVALPEKKALTFSGIGIYRPKLFEAVACGSVSRLAPLLREAVDAGKVGGQYYGGVWTDVGTPERLRLIDLRLNRGSMHAENSR